jgi:hypothetical protein
MRKVSVPPYCGFPCWSHQFFIAAVVVVVAAVVDVIGVVEVFVVVILVVWVVGVVSVPQETSTIDDIKRNDSINQIILLFTFSLPYT